MPERRPRSRFVSAAALACFASLSVLSCSSDGGGPTAPTVTTGTVAVAVATSGPDAPAAFTAALDDGTPRSIEANGSMSFTGVAGGSHTVTLGDVPGNCTVGGTNPRAASVAAGQTANVAFAVTCVALTGILEVTAETTGADVDPDGYAVEIDGGSGLAIGVNATLAPQELTTGDHEVELTGLAANCMVAGSNPRTVTVATDETVSTTFEVTCDATTGAIEVTTTTTGSDIDADGYTVDLDGESDQAVDANGAVTFTGVSEGAHSVTLTGIAANCTVTGDNPVAATVVAGETEAVAFDLTCTAVTGDLRVTANTTGSPLDPDGYTVSVDGGGAVNLGVNGDTITLSSTPEGDRSVLLGDIDPGCVATSPNPATASVPAGGEVLAVFDVECTMDLGAIELTTVTTGDDVDPDGYTVSLDGGAAQAIANDDVIVFDALAVGSHSLLLDGIAVNCTVQGDNPEMPVVLANDTTDVTMTVDCAEIPNLAPTVTISSPDTTSTVAPLHVEPGDPVTFTGAATDPEDGALTGGSLVWVSNVDGQIGTGETFMTSSLSEGQHAVTLTATDSELASDTETVLVIVNPPPAPGYQIALRLAEGTTLTAGQQTAIDDAVVKLESIVTGDLPDLPTAFSSGTCGPTVPAIDETIDDLVVYLAVQPIDGPGGVLGQAGPCWVRGGSFLPALGIMTFDSADMANLEAAGQVDEVLLHEAMHVMGFGTIWTAPGIELLVDPTGVNDDPPPDTHFPGAAAIAQFDVVSAGMYTGGEVVPVENDNAIFGLGSLNSHWRESVFAHELMTPAINGGVNPLSVVTVGQFEDLGYAVDLGEADPYVHTFSLQAQGGAVGLDLHNDIWQGPLWVVEQSGDARRIR